MAIYGRHREQWDPTKIKSKTSKNKTYELKTATASISGSSLNSSPYTVGSPASQYNNTIWHYVDGGNVNNATDVNYQPRPPTSAVANLDTPGSPVSSNIFQFGGSGGVSAPWRILSHKGQWNGEVTITFKLIAGSNIDANGENKKIRRANQPSEAAPTAFGNFGTSGWYWLTGTSSPYLPVQLAWSTNGFDQNATWTAVADYHSHGGSHPNASTENFNGTGFNEFSVTFNPGVPNFYIGLIQNPGTNSGHAWAVADFTITEPPRTITRHKLTDTMFYRFFMNNDGDAKITAAERETRVSTDAFHLQGYRNQAITKYPSGWNPPSIDIDASRFGKAINFGTSANYSATVQDQYNMIAQQAPTEWTLDQLFGDSGTYSEPGARQIYFSFWFRRDTQNAVNDGHTFAMLAYEGNQNRSLPHSTDPRISFYCNSTGQMHMRFADETSDGSGNPGDKYVTIDGTPAFLQCGSDALRVGIGTWHYVTFAVKLTSGWDVDEIVDNTMIFIDGVKDPDPQTPVKRNKTAFTVGLPGDAIWEWNFGSLINSYGAYDSSDQTLRRSSGFKGALGEFTVITNSGSSDAERIEFAKFLYEASREGANALHSGAHSSSPRLEQLDLDRDSAYPSNFTMNSYTKFSDNLQYASGRDPRVGLQPSDAFEEGYNTGETWKEKAGKYHIQSTVTSGTESVTVMPHLRLNPADTILTNGNWYSDARSEFFSEDLNATSGFVVSNTNDSASTKHVPIVSDELYREHISTDLPAFVESDMGEEFKDCFVIEIPLPHTGGSLKLSTDAEDTTGGVSNEIAMRRFNSAGPTGSTVDPVQKINTMAYYNFKDKKWEYTVPSYTTYSPDGQAGGLPWTGTGDIGFSPLSGLVFPKQGRNLDHFASLYGKPMTDCGFPFHKKFESEVGQTIDLSKYLDESVILEGWEIHCDVIPRVGYSHNITNGAAVNTEDGYSAVYPTMNKTPLYYGATGEAAVFWDPDAGETVPFYEKRFSDPGGGYYFNNTIPVSSFSSTYVTGSDGSITETKTENKPNKLAKGLVTKGVTAFLLKETDLFSKENQRQKFLRTQSRIITGNANDLGSGNSYRYDRAGSFAGAIQDYSGFSDATIDSRTEASAIGKMFPPSSYEFYEPNTTRYSRGSSRELIGYLQQLYHNDPSGSLDRSYWAREEGGSTSGGIVPNWRTQESIVKLLDKENDVYVSNLLRENTDIHPLSVSGSCKIQTPYAGSFPISNFKITGNSGSTNSGTLGVYKHSLTAPETIDIHHAYGVIPSSEGSTFSEFIQHDTVPSIQGKDKAVSLELPESLYPAGIPQDNAADWATKVLSPFDVSIPQNEECDVVLRPTDKLILGIQDSISTTFASQQIQHNADGAQFVRWGRNYLELPDSQSGYLRLYVRRTRNDKTYNAIADESTYNANVSRDLGDHLIDDDFIVQPPLMYSGSMADDIIGPTFFTAPEMSIDCPNALTGSPVSVTKAKQFYKNVEALNLGEKRGVFVKNTKWGHGASSSIVSPWGLWDDSGFTNIPWNELSNACFQQRGQSQTKRYPAVPWEEYSNSDTRGDYAGSNSAAPTHTDSGMYSGSAKTAYKFLQAMQWVVVKPDPNAAEIWSNSGTAFNNTTSGPTHPENAHGNNRPIKTPWKWGTDIITGDTWLAREGMTSVLDELNPNSGAASSGLVDIWWYTGQVRKKTDMTITGLLNPAVGAWSFKPLLPLWFQDAGKMAPEISTVQPEFRLVNMDCAGSHAYGIAPTDTDGNTFSKGDMFYFWQDPSNSSNQKCVKLPTLSAYDSSPSSYTDDKYKWGRNWTNGRASDGGPVIYIVAGDITFGSGDGVSTYSGMSVDGMSWPEIFTKISETLDVQRKICLEFLYRIVNTNINGGFKIMLPQDPTLRSTMSAFQSTINASMDSQLCGTSIVGDTTLTDILDTKLRLYWDPQNSQSAPAGTSICYVGDLGTSYTNYNDWVAAGTPSAEDLYTDGVTCLLGYYKSSPVGTNGQRCFTIERTNFLSDVLKPLTGITSVAMTNLVGGSPPSPYEAPADGYVPAQVPSITDMTISYANLIRTVPQLQIIKETYNDTIDRRIDRFVQFRTTEDAKSPSETGYVKRAGPFGSLKNYISLSDTNAFLDSFPSEAYASLSQDFLLNSTIPLEFPFENSENRIFELPVKTLRMPMSKSTSGGPILVNPEENRTVEISTVSSDTDLGTVAYGMNTISIGDVTDGTNGTLYVTNYIHDRFAGAQDFSLKTIQDLFLGFGEGASRQLNRLRPDVHQNPLDLSSYYARKSDGTQTKITTQFTLDPIRGAKFGLYNTKPSFGNYKFNYRHFGHLRDMLEQSIDTKYQNYAQDERVYGSPVVVSPVNPINPEVPKLMENTSRYNKTANATVKKPFIESNYEATPQPVNLNSETLRVDVAGSIRTRGVTAPGNIAANIRSRG